MAEILYFHGSRQELTTALSQLGKIVAGKTGDSSGLVKALQLRAGMTLLSKIQQAFIVKSRGGTGDDGITWPPLKRATIANRRVSASEKKALGIGGKRVRGLLTPAQDARWRDVYRKNLAMLIANGEANPKGIAAKIAWATLKKEGAKTKLEVLGGRKVDTLRDTGELLRSLTPGVQSQPSGADGQILRVMPGSVVVGTNKKPWHHAGVPGRLPARPLWPETIPDTWWEAIQDSFNQGLKKIIEAMVANGGRL